MIINRIHKGNTMIKKLSMSLLLAALVAAQAPLVAMQPTSPAATTTAKPDTNSWSNFFWGTGTRKAATIGSGIAALFAGWFLWKKFTAKPEETTTDTIPKGVAKEDVKEPPVIGASTTTTEAPKPAQTDHEAELARRRSNPKYMAEFNRFSFPAR